MARAKKSAPQYVRHKVAEAWGIGLLVDETPDQQTFVFTDGSRRTLKRELAAKFLESSPPPAEEDALRLARGKASGAVATPKAINRDLEAQLQQGDADAALVYGDWLQNRGDPRGDLINVQHHLEQHPDDKAARKAEAALLAQHGAYFLPPLLAQMLAVPRRKTDRPGAHTEVVWMRGFMERVRITRRSDTSPDLGAMIEELLRHPSAQLLKSLVIGPLGNAKRYDYRPVVSAIARVKPATLEELVVGDFTEQDAGVTQALLGNAYPLIAACKGLRRLRLRAFTVRFDAVPKHASLESLSITTIDVANGTLSQLLDAQLPALAELELVQSAHDHSLSELDRLATATPFPKLRKLALRGTRATNKVVGALVGRPLLKQLAALDLADGDLTDESAQVFLDRAQLLEHLDTLVLERNRLTPPCVDALARRFGSAVAAGQTQGTRAAISPHQIAGLAPDTASMTAARKLAKPDAWLDLGRDGDRLWGEYEGSDHYYVMATVRGDRMGCSCPSEKDPCKHALALLLIAAAHPIRDRPIPGAVVRHTQSRTRWYESTGL